MPLATLHEGIRVTKKTPGSLNPCEAVCPKEGMRAEDFGRMLRCEVCGRVWNAFEYEEMIAKPLDVPEKSETPPPAVIDHGALVPKRRMESQADDLMRRLAFHQRKEPEKPRPPDPYVIHRAKIPESVERWEVKK